MAWDYSSTLKDRFHYARDCLIRMFPCQRRPGKSYQGFVKARAQLTRSIHEPLQRHLATLHQQTVPHTFRIGPWVPLAMDGSLFTTTRTRANEKEIGCAGRDKASPQIATTVLYHVGTGLPWDGHMGAGRTSERTLLRPMLDRLPKRTLLIGDAGFTGFTLFQEFLSRKISFLIRVSSRDVFLTGLTNRPHTSLRQGKIVWFWPTRQRHQPPIALRLICLKVKSKSKCARGRIPVYLVTNVLDEKLLSPEQAGQFYQKRWGIEVLFRSFKETFALGKLYSRAPRPAYEELYWGFVSLLLLTMMSISSAKIPPVRRSLAGALRIVRFAMRTARPWRRKGDVRVLLYQAVQDSYQRQSAKQSRDWPRKKQERPPNPPQIRPATIKEIACAERFYDNAA